MGRTYLHKVVKENPDKTLEQNFLLLVKKLEKLFEGLYFPNQREHNVTKQAKEEHGFERDKSSDPTPATQHIRSNAGRVHKLLPGQGT